MTTARYVFSASLHFAITDSRISREVANNNTPDVSRSILWTGHNLTSCVRRDNCLRRIASACWCVSFVVPTDSSPAGLLIAIRSRSEYKISSCDGMLLAGLPEAPTSTMSPSFISKLCCVTVTPLTLTQPVCNRCLILLRAHVCSCMFKNGKRVAVALTCNVSDIELNLIRWI
jgi:hypothetical protein